jgi:hypothetical protein
MMIQVKNGNTKFDYGLCNIRRFDYLDSLRVRILSVGEMTSPFQFLRSPFCLCQQFQRGRISCPPQQYGPAISVVERNPRNMTMRLQHLIILLCFIHLLTSRNATAFLADSVPCRTTLVMDWMRSTLFASPSDSSKEQRELEIKRKVS